MKQYNEIKLLHPGALLLFRVGDFYETFGEDAITAAKVLGITLTKRGNGSASEIELAGFPHHSLDTYLPKLVRAGHRVAVCDQLEDPKLAKGIVKRGVTELVSPGVVFSEKLLEGHRNNFLCAVHLTAPGKSSINAGVNLNAQGDWLYGLAFADVSTGEFFVAEGTQAQALKLIAALEPSEILVAKSHHRSFKENFGGEGNPGSSGANSIHWVDDWAWQMDYAMELLTKHFGTQSLKGFGVEAMQAAQIAAGCVLHYLSEARHPNLTHLQSLTRLDAQPTVWMDRFTLRSLELIEPLQAGGTSLAHILDRARTPMGSRMVRRWLAFPLVDLDQIKQRQAIVHFFVQADGFREGFTTMLKQLGDLERLAGRLAVGRTSPRELNALEAALATLEQIRKGCMASTEEILSRFGEAIDSLPALKAHLQKTLTSEAPAALGRGETIAKGIHAGLDELRELKQSAKTTLAAIEAREREATGISSLKIGVNNVFGYFLEVTHLHKAKVPESWIRKQTLTGAERYITEELKEYEDKITHADERIAQIEETLFRELLQHCAGHVGILQKSARAAAELDALLGFAHAAVDWGYSRPEVDDGLVIDIAAGRHPVIEARMPVEETFIPNDLLLDPASQQIIMVTGPNMAGKSALLRQTALIVIMAQVGSFVPARIARIGMVDKVFSRVGASDNLSGGESTFMVEMAETAAIFNNLSVRSLILLDEIGRGTATYDGISIAWALAEHLHENSATVRPRTLFATHYHELNDMATSFERIKNYHVSVHEDAGRVVFLRKLVAGGSEHSFGIHVARLAGVPVKVVRRAEEVLAELEEQVRSGQHKPAKVQRKTHQLSLFSPADPQVMELIELIERIPLETTTPVEALFKLQELKRRVDFITNS